MRSIQTKTLPATNTAAPKDARAIAQEAGISFDHLQAMVDEMEKNLSHDDPADTAQAGS